MLSVPTIESSSIRDHIVGLDVRIPLLNGTTTYPINLDNAASTPALRSVLATVNDFMNWYSSIHRGAGFKSRLATRVYEEARSIVGRFVGAHTDQHVVIFGKNTTEAINILAQRIAFNPDAVILCSQIEHHSNDLPWRRVAEVKHIQVDQQGRLDEAHYARLLREYAGRVRLVAISGGSNVTGVIPPIQRLAVQAHAAGAEIFVDCAQLAPHRTIDIRTLDDPTHLDYVAFSGHKLYAPFGCGALIGRRDTFAQGEPSYVGGGTVRSVTESTVAWTDSPGRDEAGSPNVVGAVALAAAVNTLTMLGMETVAAHETELTAYALQRLAQVPCIRIYGETDPEAAHTRLGVIPLAIEGVAHGLVASILSNEYGIAVRHGSFCAQPYLRRLLERPDTEIDCGQTASNTQPPAASPGLVRISFGMYNTLDEIDTLAEALTTIAQHAYQGNYALDPVTGEYQPQGWNLDTRRYFSLGPVVGRSVTPEAAVVVPSGD